MVIMTVKEIIGIMGGVSPYPQLPLLGGAGWKKVTKGVQLPTTMMAGAGATKAGGKNGMTGPNKTNRIMSRPPAAAGAAMTAQTMTGMFDSVVKKLRALWVGGRADIKLCKTFCDLLP